MDQLTTAFRIKKLFETLNSLELDIVASKDGHLYVRSYSCNEDTAELYDLSEYFLIDKKENQLSNKFPIFRHFELVEKL